MRWDIVDDKDEEEEEPIPPLAKAVSSDVRGATEEVGAVFNAAVGAVGADKEFETADAAFVETAAAEADADLGAAEFAFAELNPPPPPPLEYG